jgi:CheY-like chemotaxis protein
LILADLSLLPYIQIKPNSINISIFIEKSLQMLRILIIEDTPERQKILQNLYKDHAWILVHTAKRAIRLIEAYDFDLISLDFNLAGEETGDEVAIAIANSSNKNAKVIIHSMNHPGAKKISEILPNADIVPFSKIIKSNAVFKRLREELEMGVDIDWKFVFSQE